MARSIAITSGKGGVGKTNAATNIGVALARLGRRVCIFDADLGLANVNILTGQTPVRTIENLVNDECTIDDLIMDGPAGIHVVPSGSGVEKLSLIDPGQVASLRTGLEKLEADHDYLLIDTAAGLGQDVLGFVKSAHEAVVVVSPEPTSMTDAYALVKVLHRQGYKKNFSILVNMAASEEEALKIFTSFNNASRKFLSRELKYLGFVARDYALASSVLKQTPVTVLYPESMAAKCFANLAMAIDSGYGPNGVGGFSGAWTSLLSTPAPVRRFPQDAAVAEFDRMQRWLESEEASEAAAREALGKLEASFVKRFGKPYADFRAGLFNLLDFADVSPSSIKEAAILLESIHERRFGKPIFEVEDAMLKALSACDSEMRMQNLIGTLESSFARRFGRKSHSLEERMEREAAEGLLTPGRMKSIVGAMDGWHREQHGEPLRPNGMIPASELASVAAKFGESDKWLGEIQSILEILAIERDQARRILDELTGKPHPDSNAG